MLRQFNLLLVLLVALAVGGGVAWLIYDDQRTETVVVAAGARSSEGFQLVEAIAKVVHAHHPRIRLEVIETGGSLDNNRLLEDGYADLALLQADAISSRRARLVAHLYPDAYQLIVHRSSGIKSVADLAGKTVALPSRGSAQLTSFWYLANHYGLSEGDLTGLSMSNRSAEWAIISNAVDAAFRVRAPGDASVKQLVERADIALVPIEQAPALHLRKASINPGRIPKGSYRGHPPLPTSDLVTASVDRLLVAADGVSENTIYAITEVLFERRRELSELSSLASLISSPDTGTGTTLPMHSGALRYYDRDKPTFLSQQADFLRTMLSLLVLFASMFFGFRNWFQGVQKNRADAYNKDLLEIYERAQRGDLAPEGYRDALAEILIRVVNDLDNDRISRNGFDEFSFTWQAVSQLLDRPATPVPDGET
jgi:TRAP transporter TAXI family solute receptor